jgi:hypothetical protein
MNGWEEYNRGWAVLYRRTRLFVLHQTRTFKKKKKKKSTITEKEKKLKKKDERISTSFFFFKRIIIIYRLRIAHLCCVHTRTTHTHVLH